MILGGLSCGSGAEAATVEYPVAGCTLTDDNKLGVIVGYHYSCNMPVGAAAQALKVVVYYSWSYAPPANSSGKPFNSTISCILESIEQHGLTVTSVSATLALPVSKAVPVTTGQLTLPSLPNAGGGYALACDMPVDLPNYFVSTMGSFKTVTQ
jgi:hypothetical protein